MPPACPPADLIRSSLLRWLMDPRLEVAPELRATLSSELLSARGTIIMKALNGLMLSVLALYLARNPIFVVFAVLEVVCCAVRIAVLRRVTAASTTGRPRPIDVAVALSILWCALQGALSFAAMQSGVSVLQTLSATMIMGITGPICARNYPAPRLALLLILLCDLPFVLGGSFSGDLWLLALLPLTPPFLIGAWQIVVNLQRSSLLSLTAELNSRTRAIRDPLTGLRNRLAFAETMSDPALTQSEGFALLCLDLDGFKSVNDSLGHLAGDSLLESVAERMTSSLRRDDSIFRLGGDEFVILLRSLPCGSIDAVARDIISAISCEPHLLDGLPPLKVGVSVGYACFPEDGRDPRELHRRADLALYQSKAAGKGRQSRYTGDASMGLASLRAALPA